MGLAVFLVEPAVLASGGGQIVLDGDEGRHAATVRRIRPGERIELTDGRGRLARCMVTAAGRASLTCEVEDYLVLAPPQPRLVAVQALPKGERATLAVETMTEVGVDEIVPWAAARCVTRWQGERGAKARERWGATAREAAKQARRAWLPEIADLASTRDVASRLAAAALGVVLHEEASEPISQLELPAAGEIVLVVGPEGGVSPEELDALAAAGARAVRLGPTVLRTSTAGAVAAGILLSRTPRWAG